MNDPCKEIIVRLGKAQVDAMFGRQDEGPLIDDAEFVPLVESVLTAFETTLMWTDTSEFRNPHYHLPTDTPETLDYEFLAGVTRLLVHAVLSDLGDFR